jgi:lysine biosynthesis protein LysW
MKTILKLTFMKCQDCQTEMAIAQGSVKVGDIYDCPNCGAEYEITKLDPLRAELIEEEK